MSRTANFVTVWSHRRSTPRNKVWGSLRVRCTLNSTWTLTKNHKFIRVEYFHGSSSQDHSLVLTTRLMMQFEINSPRIKAKRLTLDHTQMIIQSPLSQQTACWSVANCSEKCILGILLSLIHLQARSKEWSLDKIFSLGWIYEYREIVISNLIN